MMEIVRGIVERDRLIDGVWTGYSQPLDRSILKKRKFLDPAPPRPDPARQKQYRARSRRRNPPPHHLRRSFRMRFGTIDRDATSCTAA